MSEPRRRPRLKLTQSRTSRRTKQPAQAIVLQPEELQRIIEDAIAQRAETIAEAILERLAGKLEPDATARGPLALDDAEPIDAIPLPVRVLGALRRAGVTTVGELGNLRERELLRWRNFGPASLMQLKDHLALYGRRLAR